MLTIGIDIDDTLTDTTGVVKECIKESNNSELINNMDKIILGQYVSDETILIYEKMHDRLINDVKVKEGAKKVLDRLHGEGYKIIFVTARADDHFGDAYKVCYDYLVKNDIFFDKLLVGCFYKVETCKDEKIDILIDDSVDTVEKAISSHIDAILMNSSLNKDRKTSAPRFGTWEDIYKYIHEKYGDH